MIGIIGESLLVSYFSTAVFYKSHILFFCQNFLKIRYQFLAVLRTILARFFLQSILIIFCERREAPGSGVAMYICLYIIKHFSPYRNHFLNFFWFLIANVQKSNDTPRFAIEDDLPDTVYFQQPNNLNVSLLNTYSQNYERYG